MRSLLRHLLFEKHPVDRHKALERERGGDSTNSGTIEGQFPYCPLKRAVPPGRRWARSVQITHRLMFGSRFPAKF